jgi:hypothetical protein
MKISQNKYTQNNVRNMYVVLRSKDGMKRSHWTDVATFKCLDDAAEYLCQRKDHYLYSEYYKYQIVYRQITTKDVSVSLEEIMVMRIKHGF